MVGCVLILRSSNDLTFSGLSSFQQAPSLIESAKAAATGQQG
jgi:hypothetical protein